MNPLTIISLLCIGLLAACGPESGVRNPDFFPDAGETTIIDAPGLETGSETGNGPDVKAPGETGADHAQDAPLFDAPCKTYRYCLWALPGQGRRLCGPVRGSGPPPRGTGDLGSLPGLPHHLRTASSPTVPRTWNVTCPNASKNTWRAFTATCTRTAWTCEAA